MELLELVARESLTRMGSTFSEQQPSDPVLVREAAHIYYGDFVNKNEDEGNWSISNLRRQLRLKGSHRLFRRYQMRVQHALFVELLLLNLIFNGIVLIVAPLHFLDHKNQEYRSTSMWCRAFTMGTNIVIFISALVRERWFNNSSTLRAIAALTTLGSMTLSEMGPTVILGIPREEHQELLAFYIVLTSAVLLPFSRKLYGACAATVVIAVDLTLTAITSHCDYHKTPLHLIKEGFYLLIALGAGLWMRHLVEVMGRRNFLDRRECLESKMNIENEKEREEQLLQSIFPEHVAQVFREDFRCLVRKMVGNRHYAVNVSSLQRRKPFNKLYVKPHTNVSILYADIVNSMLLCASLQVADLVDTLDDLFGRFDRAAELNNCMRIKLLGDCYYCVAGLPNVDKKPDDTEDRIHHADDCVRTGILMIMIIRQVRENRHVDVDMRIGIHSGRVLGGLLGLKKWQYDVWSRDVSIASHMEQAGVPGLVHITKETKELLQENYGVIRTGDGHLKDPYLAQEGIRTFLIAPTKTYKERLSTDERAIFRFKRQSFSIDDDWRASVVDSRYSDGGQSYNLVPKRRRAVLDYSLLDFRIMIEKVNKKMERAIDKMALGKKDQWCSSEGVHPLFLTFQEWRSLEWPYLMQTDPLFKYYLICSLLVFIGIVLLQMTATLGGSAVPVGGNSTNITHPVHFKNDVIVMWAMHGITFAVVITICFTSWIGYLNMLIKGDSILQEATVRQSYFLNLSRRVWQTSLIRNFLWCLTSVMIVGCSLIGVYTGLQRAPSHENNSTLKHDLDHEENLCEPNWWLHTACVTLALTSTSVFIRVHYLLKLVIESTGLLVFCFLQQLPSKRLTHEGAHHCFYLGLVVLILHMLDRQVEYVCRLDFVWRWRLKKEQDEARTVELVNRLLLNNILPKHVQQFYLHDRKRLGSEAPYHEECSSVAILFASIPNFSHFYCEDKLNEAGRRCIQLLNEIVCDFDLLLLQKRYSRVEKIKTIGSTYMAACGLHTDDATFIMKAEGRQEVEQDRRRRNVVTLARFATEMMATLRELNKDALQELQLRIGLAVGRVMAGVVGSMRPQFDIWGDAVNVASRMDSTGIPGRIQVTEEVADIIKASESFECECRGQIFVKGKGELTTYFLKTIYDEPNCEDTKF